MTKEEALAEVYARGYTIQFDTTQEPKRGSNRTYFFRKPGAEMNELSQPKEFATVRRAATGWETSYSS